MKHGNRVDFRIRKKDKWLNDYLDSLPEDTDLTVLCREIFKSYIKSTPAKMLPRIPTKIEEPLINPEELLDQFIIRS